MPNRGLSDGVVPIGESEGVMIPGKWEKDDGRIEVPVGEVIRHSEHEGRTKEGAYHSIRLKCVEGQCERCSLSYPSYWCKRLVCTKAQRKDGKDVIFV